LNYREGESLSQCIYGAILQYEESRLQYWGTPDPDTEVNPNIMQHVRDTDELARKIWRASAELTTTADLANFYSTAGNPARHLDGMPAGYKQLALEELEIGCAYESTDDIEEQAERCLELCEHTLRVRPNTAVSRYLRRLARCYVVGFFPECVMLCRSVLENGIKEKFDQKKIPLPATAQGRSVMSVNIEAARQFKWLSDPSAKQAMVIWRRGSKAVHEDPEATSEVWDTIRSTMQILNELYSS